MRFSPGEEALNQMNKENMKTKIYLRITNKTGKGKPSVKVSMKPDYSPIESVGYYGRKSKFYPTVAFAVEIDIPDASFKRAEEVVATLNLMEDKVKINEIKSSL